MNAASLMVSFLEELEQLVRPVMNLQATELPGQRVRVSWNPVPEATKYRVIVRTQGKAQAARKVPSSRSPSLQYPPTLAWFLWPPSSLGPFAF